MTDAELADLKRQLLRRLISGEIDEPTYERLVQELQQLDRSSSADSGSDTIGLHPTGHSDQLATPQPAADAGEHESIGHWVTGGPRRPQAGGRTDSPAR